MNFIRIERAVAGAYFRQGLLREWRGLIERGVAEERAANQIKCSIMTLRRWREEFRAEGFEGLVY